jgi:glutamate-1-semialdehyde 2,1-aminomutase
MTDVLTLDQALSEAVNSFEAANPTSAARHRSAGESMPGGNTRTVLFHPPFPLAFASGHDARLTSLDGRDYIDFLGEYTAGIFGHSNTAIITALHAALDRGISFGGHNALEGALAAAMISRFPNLDSVRFTNPGTEANLMAIALAKAATGRPQIVVFSGGYHGGLLSFVGGVSSPVNVPHDWVIAKFNDIVGTRKLIREHSANLAAVLVEPMIGSGGAIRGSDGFFQMLRAETTEAGANLIFDEVMTSRLAPGGFQTVVDVVPDLTTFGKYLGGRDVVRSFWRPEGPHEPLRPNLPGLSAARGHVQQQRAHNDRRPRWPSGRSRRSRFARTKRPWGPTSS